VDEQQQKVGSSVVLLIFSFLTYGWPVKEEKKGKGKAAKS